MILDITEQAKVVKEEITGDPTIDDIMYRIIDRSNAGRERFGKTIRNNNDKTLVQWIEDVQEELWDAVVYLQKVREKLVEHDIGDLQ